MIDNNTERYQQDKIKYPSTISRQNNKKAKSTLSPIDYSMSNKDKTTLNDQKKRKATSSSQPVVSKKKSVSLSLPSQATNYRLANFQCRSIIHLLKERYSDLFNNLLVEIQNHENLFDSEAKISNKSITKGQQDSDDDDDDDSFIDEDESLNVEDDNSSYLRTENNNNIQDEVEWDEETQNSIPVIKKQRSSPKKKPSPNKKGVTSSSNSNKGKKPPPPPPRNHPSREMKTPSK